MMAPGNYRPDGSPIIGISPSIAPKAVDPNAIDNRLRGLRGILETPEMLAGGGTKAGGGTIPIPGYNPRDMDNQISVRNIDDQGNITGQTGLGRMVAKYGNIKDLDSFSPELQAAIQGYQSRPEGGGIFGNLGIGVGALGSGLNQPLSNPTANPNGNIAQERPEFDEYGQPSMHTPGMQQIQVPNPNYGIKPTNTQGGGLYPNEIGTQKPGEPRELFGLPDYQYQGDSPFGDIFNDFYGSGAGSAMQTADMAYNPFTGTYGSSSQRGDMHRFISGAYEDMQGQMNNDMVKSQEFMDKYKMYGDAMNTYNDFQSEQAKEQSKFKLAPGGGLTTSPPLFGEQEQQPGGGMEAGIPEYNMKMPKQPTSPDFFTADYDHLKNIGAPSPLPDFGEPVTEMPTPGTGGMNSDFANQLLSGIGNLFDKYLSSPSMKQDNLGMGSTNQITPPTPPEQMMTADTQSSMPNSLGSLGSQGMFTPGRGY